MSVIVIPIDASQIADADRKQQKVKVGIQQGSVTKSQIVALAGGKASVSIEADPKLPAVIAIGPETASDADLFHLQTLTATVNPRQWGREASLTVSPFVVTTKWWGQWLIWCREFVITGRLLCADGSPVPGAEVHAYNVDFFWWWSSLQQVGATAITDAGGHFTITFRWCCGWWPWWWWRLREWRLESDLVDKIYPVVKLNPTLKFPQPSPVPTFDFAALANRPVPTLPTIPGRQLTVAPVTISPVLAINRQVDPSVLPVLREKIIAALPSVPEFERLRIWPWWPWTPWFDCSPSIIFRATQNCGGTQTKLIVDESVFQTRWDIPTSLNVNLVASQDACCIPPVNPDPVGDCMLITGVCGDPGIPVTSIGSTGLLAGYADPGTTDQPFAETVYVSGQFGSSSQADFYEIEYATHSDLPHVPADWNPLPSAALLDMARGYFDATQPWPNQWFNAPFPVIPFGGKNFYESRHHYEATHGPANWGSPLTGRSWTSNVNQIAFIQTQGNLLDGAYDFQVVGYKADGAGNPDLTTRKVMDGCGNNAHNNLLTLRIDNRVVGPAVPDTVHIDTTEPDCGINAVRIGGVGVLPCGAQPLKAGESLEIDYFATDPDGHLDHYELVVKFGLGSEKNLLSSADVGSFNIVTVVGGPSGPTYAQAVTAPETASRPIWNGGTLTLHIDNASNVFPQTCCYLIELTVWKRNIVNCGGPPYYNQMHYSFTVTV